MHTRVQGLRQRLADDGIDAIFITNPQNRRYLSGFTGSAGYLIVSQNHAFLATDFRYWEQAELQSPDFELVKLEGSEMKVWLGAVLAKAQPETLGFEAGHVTYTFHELLKRAVRRLKTALRPKLAPTLDLVESLRLYKDDEELSIITKAVDIADAAMMEVTAILEPGMTERHVGWLMERSMREHGADSMSFDIIVAAGANGARPHHRPSDQPIKEGEPIVIDMGARLQGYCSDITRTVCLGKPDDTYKRVYDTVLTAQEAAIAAVQSGMTGHEGDKLTRDIIEKAGYGDKFGHGTGHGVGLDIHENPRVSRNMKDELKDGMIFTIEPGIYLPGWGGVRIEDIVVLERGKARDLTKASKMDVASGR